MITAKQVYQQMIAAGAVDEEALDTFINEIIVPRFVDEQETVIKLNTLVFNISPLFVGKTPERICNMLNKRGFRMELKTDEHIFGDTWYELEIPPQNY